MEGGVGACLKGKGGELCRAILRSWFVILRPWALNLVSQHKARGAYVRYCPYAYMCRGFQMNQVGYVFCTCTEHGIYMCVLNVKWMN